LLPLLLLLLLPQHSLYTGQWAFAKLQLLDPALLLRLPLLLLLLPQATWRATAALLPAAQQASGTKMMLQQLRCRPQQPAAQQLGVYCSATRSRHPAGGFLSRALAVSCQNALRQAT
jgi:hypothetical protein